tara:strand:- start:484 stop:813 length:330 start_codon:yes stop_codon:yes gene_type:complete
MKKKILKITIFLLTLNILNACGGSMSDAGKVLRNEKITNKDEFFIKKRAPLVLPPDYEKIPKPGTSKSSNSSIDSDKKINEILNIPKEKSTSSSEKTTVEKSILEKIKK